MSTKQWCSVVQVEAHLPARVCNLTTGLADYTDTRTLATMIFVEEVEDVLNKRTGGVRRVEGSMI